MLSSGATTAEVVKKLRVSKNYVYLVKQKTKNDRPTKVVKVGSAKVANSSPTTTAWLERNPWFGNGKDADLDKTAVALAAHEKVLRSGVAVDSDKYYARIDAQMRKYDKEVEGGSVPHEANMVSHPPHYTVGGIEVIDFIEAKGLSYHLGNVVKYVSRAGKKDDALQDLQKARWYLERAIQQAE